MKRAINNWIWFIALVLLVVGAGIYLGQGRRAELGESFAYSLDEYRTVDPALVRYAESAPVVPSIEGISALAIGPDGALHVAGENAVERIPGGPVVRVEGTPTCLAVDEDGNVYLGMGGHVEVLYADGARAVWPSLGERAYLTSIAADGGRVYVADAGGRKVWTLDGDGAPVFEFGGLVVPSPCLDLAVGADGSLWVVNPGRHAFENRRADGTLIAQWQRSSISIEGFSGCCNPAHFALLPDGGFVTAEKGLPRVKIHNVDGSLRCVVAPPDRFDAGADGLDVAVGEAGRIYVLDPGRNVVRVFEEKP